MKKNLLTALLVISTFVSYAQPGKGNFIISFDGNYFKTNKESGVTTNLLNSNEKSLNIGSSLGYFISDQFVIGIGVDYMQGKDNRINSLYFNDILQQEQMDVKSTLFLPGVYIGSYFTITDKLYFNTNLKLGYGKLKSEYETIYAGHSPGTSTFTPYLRGTEDQSEFNYFNVRFIPELTYFISPKFGFALGLGGIEYAIIDGHEENSGWLVNFNPVYWTLGFKINI